MEPITMTNDENNPTTIRHNNEDWNVEQERNALDCHIENNHFHHRLSHNKLQRTITKISATNIANLIRRGECTPTIHCFLLVLGFGLLRIIGCKLYTFDTLIVSHIV